MKMGRIRALFLEIISAGVAIAIALTLYDWGAPWFIIIPIGVIVAWYQMGFFIDMWKSNIKKMEALNGNKKESRNV